MASFKVMFANRVYILSGATIIGLFTILTLLGLTITSSGDVICDGTIEDPCISYFNVTNKNYRSIYIYNYDEIKMDFSPEIKDYKLYVKYYGKWRFTNFTMETRLGNIPEDRKYIFVFPKYSTKEFKLIGYKNDIDDIIKWGFGVENEYLDPVWDSKFKVIEDCDTTYWKEDILQVKCRDVYYKENESTGKVCDELYNITVQRNETICKTFGWTYEDYFYNESNWCCSKSFCGLIKDYDCNYINKQEKRPEWSYNELRIANVKIDSTELKDEYLSDIVIQQESIDSK